MTSSSAQLFGKTLRSRYATLPNDFYAAVKPTPVQNPQWIVINRELANDMGFDLNQLDSAEGLALLSGQEIAPNSTPIAQAYAGHQFGYFNPQLGDGRAILLGEITTPTGAVVDIQLKGSGPTPFSRNGDGRSAIGPVVREFLVSEAMHALGIPTTRSLAAVASGEQVMRRGAVPGAILTRVASSHIRIGTFEYFRARGKHQSLKILANFVIERHYPELKNSQQPYSDLLKSVAQRQGKLVSHWMLVGFIHGVMNTDNTALSGETLDFGPCAFLDEYNPHKVFSSIDQEGRYAYGNQPEIAIWNLTRLGESLSPLAKVENQSLDQTISEAIQAFQTEFNQAWSQGLAKKIGLTDITSDQDIKLIESLLKMMHQDEADFTWCFRHLAGWLTPKQASPHALADAFAQQFPSQYQNFCEWLEQWQTRLKSTGTPLANIQASMDKVNPLYIPRNHLIEEVISAAEAGNFKPAEEMLQVLQTPFEERPEWRRYSEIPEIDQRVQQTFCGT